MAQIISDALNNESEEEKDPAETYKKIATKKNGGEKLSTET